ncbi:MAG TPA: alpha/beta fold hydrolase [Solirubrobacteraceae bacterium]|nr:alpha/beta fold hydrolase [Solirubrobacteraceae bacterium]
MPTRRQQLRGAIENGLLRGGPDETYADGDDSTWMSVDWPAMTRRMPIAGREVNFVDTGGDDRPVIVFVHGLSGTWQNWLLNIPAFMDSHRVIAPDLPGFGESPMPLEEISIQGYARILDELLGALGLASAVVVGNSMGGFVAAELALSFSTRVERLVLVSAAGLSIEEYRRTPLLVGARIWAGTATWVGARGHSVVTRPRARRIGLQLIVRYPEKLCPALTYELTRGTGTPGFVAAMKALLSYRFRDKLARIEVPTLVVWGRNDMLVPGGDAREYVRLIGDNARREMFEDTGHLSMLERPSRFNRLLADFVAGERAPEAGVEGVNA